MYETKFNLQSFKYFVGNAIQKGQIESLIKSNSTRPIFIFGPSGTGKSVIAHYLATNLNLDLIELNASMEQDIESLKPLKLLVNSPYGLDGRKKILLIDDVDSITNKESIDFLSSLIRTTKIPIIITAQSSKVSPKIRFACHQFDFKKVNAKEMLDFINLIAARENLTLSRREKLKIISESHGDIRSLFFAFEFGLGKVKQEPDYSYHPRKRILVSLSRLKSSSEFKSRRDQNLLFDQLERRRQYFFFDKLRSILI